MNIHRPWLFSNGRSALAIPTRRMLRLWMMVYFSSKAAFFCRLHHCWLHKLLQCPQWPSRGLTKNTSALISRFFLGSHEKACTGFCGCVPHLPAQYGGDTQTGRFTSAAAHPSPYMVWYLLGFCGWSSLLPWQECVACGGSRFSKYAYFLALSHPYTAVSVARLFFDNFFKLHGLPETMVSDRDLVFKSSFKRELFRLSGS